MTEPPTIELVLALTPDHTTEVTNLIERAAAADGFAAVNEAAMLSIRHHNSGRHPISGTTHLLARSRGVLVGYGQVLAAPDASTGVLVVAPSARRHGVGRALLGRLLDVAPTPLRVWAMTDTVAAGRLADAFGLPRVRELLIMTRSLSDPVPEPHLPPGTGVRAFIPGRDEEVWIAVNARAFAHHPEQGSLTRADLDERMAESWFDPAGFFLAETGQQIVGFHWTKQHPGRRGEVYVLGVDPDAGRQGLGTALLRVGLRHLAAVGNTEVLLYVDGAEDRAVRLYTTHGFTVASRDVMYAEPARRDGPSSLLCKPTTEQEN